MWHGASASCGPTLARPPSCTWESPSVSWLPNVQVRGRHKRDKFVCALHLKYSAPKSCTPWEYPPCKPIQAKVHVHPPTQLLCPSSCCHNPEVDRRIFYLCAGAQHLTQVCWGRHTLACLPSAEVWSQVPTAAFIYHLG